MIKLESAVKILDYTFGKNVWKQYKCVEIAVRNEKDSPNVFNDELVAIITATMEALNIVWNTDPSRYWKGTRDIAKLRTGLHFYKLSYHHIWDNAKRYVALRPNTPDERLKVWRKTESGKVYEDFGQAINQHAGGNIGTGSEGCQTAKAKDYPQFIKFIGKALGVTIPLGNIKKPNPQFTKGIGNIPYILITQNQFNYIMNLPESLFDSPADIAYQMKNFVNMPKIEKVLPVESKVEAVISNAEIVANLERSENQFIDSNALNESEMAETEQGSNEAEKPSENAPNGEQSNTENVSVEVQDGNVKVETNKEQATSAKVAIEKTESKNFFRILWTEISGLFAGNFTLQAIREYAEQVQFLGLSARFWAWIVTIAAVASVIYLIMRFLKYREETRRDLEITNQLIQANSTENNEVVLFDADKKQTYEALGYKIITR